MIFEPIQFNQIKEPFIKYIKVQYNYTKVEFKIKDYPDSGV